MAAVLVAMRNDHEAACTLLTCFRLTTNLAMSYTRVPIARRVYCWKYSVVTTVGSGW